MEIIGTGDILWKLEDINGKGITIKLKNVKLIPALKNNLLSLSQIFEQFPNATEIKRDKKNLILKIKNSHIEFKLTNKLFKNSSKKEEFPIKVNVVKTTKESISIEKFRNEHLKMAHLNSQDLASTLRSQGFKISNKIIKDFICEDCLKTKSTIKRPEQTGRIASENTTSGSFIHSDIAGPEPTYNNKNFMINFIDDATGATYVKFLKNKSDVPKAIKEFLQECKTSVFKLPVNDNTTFHSDGEAIY